MRSIWAVAIITIKQAVRLKIAVVFIILLIVLLPLMGISMTGDGTLKGKLQTFISYGFSLTTLLLSLLTIIISAYSLTSDIQQKQIYTVITKPIRRFQLLSGKLLGIILLNVVLLFLFSSVIYAVVIYTPRFETDVDKNELEHVNNEFFTARKGLMPPEVDVRGEVEETYKKLDATGQLPAYVFENKAFREDYKAELANRIKLGKRAVAVGSDLVWEFNNVKILDPNESLFIRFKYDVSVNPPDLQVYSKWFAGDKRQFESGGKIETPIYTSERKDLIRTFYEIKVPADAVAEDGYLAVGFFNVPLNNTVVIFPPEDGLELLYKADTFTANFLRAVLLILLRLIFLACLGILASTFLSFPVAVLLCLAVFFTGTISGFCLESFDYLSQNLSSIYSYTVRPVVKFLPQFDKFSPAKFLVPARLLSWSFLAQVVLSLVCFKAAVLWLVALLIFSYKEIAKVIV
jgi:hypothetical protein